jgi:hypothetical protein
MEWLGWVELGWYAPWSIRSTEAHGKIGKYSINVIAWLQIVQWIDSTTCYVVWRVSWGRNNVVCTQCFQGLRLAFGDWCLSGGECCNPNLGLVTKTRACKGVGQKWSSVITFHAPGSVGKCERMNTHTPKWVPTWGVWISMDSQIFKGQL